MQTIESTEETKHSQETATSAKEQNEINKLFHVFFLAWKNYCLYPQGHPAVKNSLKNLGSAFGRYLSGHDNLQLSVEKNRLLCGSDVLHEVPQDNPAEDIVFLLYRDGMQWIEFKFGLTQDELDQFFKTISDYRILVEETEGDIITALNDIGFKHITFKAVDTSWQDFPLIDFSRLNIPHHDSEEFPYHVEMDETQKLQGEARIESHTKSIADPSYSRTLWEISADENSALQKMVLEEESRDSSEDIFDVLLIILRSQNDPHNFSSVLDFTLEEVVETIEQEEFGLLLNLFQSLHQLLYKDASEDTDWMRPLIDRFFHDLSSSEIFDLLSNKLLALNDNDSEKILVLRQVLLYFSPNIILSLGPIIAQIQSREAEKMILGVIGYLSLKDIAPLEKILDQSDKNSGDKLLPLLRGLKGSRTNNILLKMTKHPSYKLRKEAARTLLSRDKSFAQKLFPLLDDTSPLVRGVILSGIAKHKSSLLENMLVKYIKENSDTKDSKHILGCYMALGKCGSGSAVPFLKRVLLSRGWNKYTGFGKLVHREGAATALALMKTTESQDILIEASKSKFSSVKEAFRNAMLTLDASEEKSNAR